MDLENRSFQVWCYSVNKSQLLIRSPKDNYNRETIDIIFTGVQYLELPTILKNIRLEEVSEEDIKHISSKLNKNIDINKITVIIAYDTRYYVVSEEKRIEKSNLNFYELPIKIGFKRNW